MVYNLSVTIITQSFNGHLCMVMSVKTEGFLWKEGSYPSRLQDELENERHSGNRTPASDIADTDWPTRSGVAHNLAHGFIIQLFSHCS